MAAFLILALYFQNTKSGMKTGQISLVVLAWKSCGMRTYYFGLVAWGLTNFPHLGVLKVVGLEGDFGHGTEVIVWRMEEGVRGANPGEVCGPIAFATGVPRNGLAGKQGRRFASLFLRPD